MSFTEVSSQVSIDTDDKDKSTNNNSLRSHIDDDHRRQKLSRLRSKLLAKETFFNRRILYMRDLMQRPCSISHLEFLSKQLDHHFYEIEIVFETLISHEHAKDNQPFDDNWV